MSLSHSPNIVRDGLVLCLDAANSKSYPGTGTTWFDIGGNGFNTSGWTGITFDTISGGALRFNGSSDPMEQTNFYNPSSSNPIFIGSLPSSTINWNGDSTYEAWVRPIVLGSTNTGYIFADNNYNEGILGINSSNIRAYWGASASLTTSFSPTINTWYQIIMTHKRQTNSTYLLSLIVNSVLISSGTNDTVDVNYGPDNRLSIGHLFNGFISNVKIYNKVLSSNEIKQNFNALRGRYEL